MVFVWATSGQWICGPSSPRRRRWGVSAPSLRKLLPARIRLVRQARGLTQAETGSRSGLGQTAISHFESGRRLPSAANLARLARCLNTSADYLLGLRGEA